MSEADAIKAEDVARAAAEVEAHERVDALAALALDVLSRQAEGRALFAGKKHVDTLAEEHGIERDEASTERGNVLEILERGAKTAGERALVTAFAVAGLRRRLTCDEATSALTSFVRHADWLETATPFAVYAFVDHVLTPDDAERVWSAAADACVSARPGALDHATRAAALVRISALAASKSDAAAEALRRVAQHAADPAIRAAASFQVAGEVGGSDPPERPIRIRGTRGRVRGGPVRETVRILSGWALVTWLARLTLSLVGFACPMEAALVPNGVELRGRVRLLGRVIREHEEVLPLEGLARLSRDVRYPSLHLLVGLTTLSAGVLIGGVMAVDALRSGATWFLLLGAFVILAGAGLDLAIDVLVPARRKRVALELAPASGTARRIEGVAPEMAERFVEAVRAKI